MVAGADAISGRARVISDMAGRHLFDVQHAQVSTDFRDGDVARARAQLLVPLQPDDVQGLVSFGDGALKGGRLSGVERFLPKGEGYDFGCHCWGNTQIDNVLFA